MIVLHGETKVYESWIGLLLLVSKKKRFCSAGDCAWPSLEILFLTCKNNSKSVLNWAVVQNEVQDHKREVPTLTATRLSKGNWVVEGICARSTKTGVNTDHGSIKLAIKDVCEITCTFLHAYSFTWLLQCVYAGVYGRFCVCVCMYASNWHRACSNKTVTQQLKSHFLIFQNFVFLFTLAGIHFYSLSVTLFMFCVCFCFFVFISSLLTLKDSWM